MLSIVYACLSGVTAAVVTAQFARVVRYFLAAKRTIVVISSRAIATRNLSVCERAYAQVVTAAVVLVARVFRFFFAAKRTIVGVASRAIATRSFSVCSRACALAVTAAVVFLAWVLT